MNPMAQVPGPIGPGLKVPLAEELLLLTEVWVYTRRDSFSILLTGANVHIPRLRNKRLSHFSNAFLIVFECVKNIEIAIT